MAKHEEAHGAVTPGAALRALRNMAGLTLKDVATHADTSIAYLSKVERDEFRPTQQYVAKVAAYIAGEVIGKETGRAA